MDLSFYQTDSQNFTRIYLEDAGFRPLKVIDLSSYPQVFKRCSFLLGTISYLIDPFSLPDDGVYAFGGAVRDAVSGLVSEDSDIDFIVSGSPGGASSYSGSFLKELKEAPRFRGATRFLPEDLFEDMPEIRSVIVPEGQTKLPDPEGILDLSKIDEGSLYEPGWGGIKGPVEMYFDSSLTPSSTKGKAISPEVLASCRRVQFLAARFCDRPDWSKMDKKFWRKLAGSIDPIEHTIRPVRMVDIICCGLILTSSGYLLEAVPGAFEDALNMRLRINKAPGVRFHNTARRLERLTKRGYVIS